MQDLLNKLNSLIIPGEDHSLADDLMMLQVYIASIRDDLGSLSPANIPGSHLPQAKDELGAVVSTTEAAANNILDACQILEKALQSCDADQRPAAEAAMTQIYEACGFQDLAGQRLSKVNRILVMLEERLNTVLHNMGIETGGAAMATQEMPQADAERALMNGPAMPGEGVGQSDIDALFD